MKRIGVMFSAIIVVCLMISCSPSIKADYSTEDAEKALNDGENPEGKTVEIIVDDLKPASAFGYNIITGEHLNFVSPENPDVKIGDKLIVEVDKTQSIIGSFIINYKLIERVSSSNKTQSSKSLTTSSSKDEMSMEDYFKVLIDSVPVINSDNYNQDEYSMYTYKDLIRNYEKLIGLKVKLINADVIQITEQGKYTQYLLKTQPGDLYMVIIETDRLETRLLDDDMINANCQLLRTYKYESKGGDDKEVPLLYINAYSLLNN